MSIVNNGVRALSIPATELGRLVWAFANKKAGIKLPTKPTDKSNIQCFLLMPFNRLSANGSRNIEAESILIAPTWPAEYIINPFLISINELPHTNARISSKPQAIKSSLLAI